jgi:hypothetical protein
MLKSSYEVEILINGKPAKEFFHDGKTYIEGREGTRFSIKLRNNSYSRKLFVPTIDGLSVMNGEEGSYKSSGYIVQGYSSITIDGWRTSDKEVAEFYFSSPEGSYRKKMDKGNNLGLIGVAVFDEVYHAPIYTYTQCYCPHCYPTITVNPFQGTGTCTNYLDLSTPTSGISGDNLKMFSVQSGNNYNLSAKNTDQVMSVTNCSGSAPSQALGTGFGEQKHSEVTSVEFERKSYTDAVFEIYYNTREELEKTGICFKKEPLYVAPQAFPGNYCKPPKN